MAKRSQLRKLPPNEMDVLAFYFLVIMIKFQK